MGPVVSVAPSTYLPTVIVYPAAFAIVAPVMPPTPSGLPNTPAAPKGPLNLLIVMLKKKEKLF